MALTENGYKKRLLDDKIEKYLNIFGAISIEGPKWCGKTWTAKNHANSEMLLDDDNIRNLAIIDKNAILNGEAPELIDEWNYVPELWDAVRRKCDENKEKGKYILTCSTTLSDEEERKKVHHSGAGRIARMQMYPMSLYESGDSTGEISISDLYRGKFENLVFDQISIEKIARLVVRGGWPENIDSNDSTILPREYMNSVLKKDINENGKKEREISKMEMLLRSLARNESTVMGNKTIIRDISDNENADDLLKSRNTVAEYIDVLKRLYIIEDQEPYSFNIRSSERIGKTAKKHFIDPSLACACLGVNEEKLISDLHTFGFMFESLVERDLKIYMDYLGGKVYHYRDNITGNEVDAIIEFENGEYAAIEIKLGFNQADVAKKSLKKFYENAPKKPKFMCIIYGVGQISVQDKETGIYIIPITKLRP